MDPLFLKKMHRYTIYCIWLTQSMSKTLHIVYNRFISLISLSQTGQSRYRNLLFPMFLFQTCEEEQDPWDDPVPIWCTQIRQKSFNLLNDCSQLTVLLPVYKTLPCIRRIPKLTQKFQEKIFVPCIRRTPKLTQKFQEKIFVPCTRRTPKLTQNIQVKTIDSFAFRRTKI